jgi:hypothetical protein
MTAWHLLPLTPAHRILRVDDGWVLGRHALAADRSPARPFVSRHHLHFRQDPTDGDRWFVKSLARHPIIRIQRADGQRGRLHPLSADQGWVPLGPGDCITLVYDEARNLHFLRYKFVKT